MLHLRKIELFASVVLFGAIFGIVPAIAQNAPTNILLPGNGAVPETDADLDGVEDSTQTSNQTEPTVIFADGSTGNEPDTEYQNLNQSGRTNDARNQLRGGATFNARPNDISNDTVADGNVRARRAQQVGTLQPDGSVIPVSNSLIQPVQGGGGDAEASPYAPLGIRLGSFTLLPVLTQRIGTTSNADFSSTGSESAFSQTDVQLSITSDWALHQLQIQLGGSYQTFFNGTSDDLPTFTSSGELRLDHTRELTSRFGVNYSLLTESAVSDNLTVPAPLFVVERPNVHRYGGFAEIAHNAGRINSTIRGTLSHTVYEGAALSDGSRLPQGDRTNTLYELRGRVGYEASPAFQPFVEASVGFRDYLYEVDRNGNRRNSNLYTIRGGLDFNRGEKLNGDVAVGYSTEQYEDGAINDLSGITFDANINWSPQRFTTFSLNGQTAFTGSTNVNEAGSVTYAATLGVVHDVRPNLSLSASVLASIQQFDGSGREDNRVQFRTGAEWRLNRNFSILGDLGYETVESTEAGSSYDALTASVGIRLQR